MKTKLNGFLTLILALLVQITFAQQKTVTGKVSDASGPLPGVTVVVKGTNTGTQTDFDGNYSISAAVGAVLQYSFVGMTTAEKTVGSANVINVVMTESAQALDEVVITAMGIKRDKKSLGYSQQSVGGEELVKAKETDISNALAGKVAGVQIVGNNSSTFGSSQIRLRGSDNVLYVVDGIKVYTESDINVDNVADISVLKGASATAIYGPEGRNGVVVITSKVAEEGKAQIQIDQSFTMNSVAAMPEYQSEYGGGYSQDFNTFSYNPASDPAEWASFDGHSYPDFWADESWGPRLDGQLVRHWDSWIPGASGFGELRPWVASNNDVESFYEDAMTSNTNLSFSKAGDDYNIRTSLSRIDQNGIIPNSSNLTTRLSINASYDLSDKFTFYTNVNYEDREMKNNPDQNYGNLGSNFNQWWQRQLDFDRLKNYDQGGQIVSWNIRGPRDARPLYWDMPYFHSYENDRNWYKNSTYGKIGGTYEFTEKLSLTAEYRKTFHSYREDDRSTTKSLLDPAFYDEDWSRNDKDEMFAMFNYSDHFMDGNLDLDLSVGAETTENDYRRLYTTTNGNLTIPSFYDLGGSSDPVSADNTTRRSKSDAIFTKASFGYKGILYLDGSYRMDWSSTANPDANRVETYGTSVSFLSHKVLPQNEVLTFAKLRMGYAKAPFFPDLYKTKTTYEVGSYLYQGNGRLSVNGTQENPNLIGGTRSEFEVGTELQFFNNKIALDLTYFNRVDEEIPVEVKLDGSTGYEDIIVNSGKQTSSGFEIGLLGDVISTDDFKWTLGVNFATLEKFVDEIYEGIESRDISTYTSSMKLQERVGEEWGLFYGRGFAEGANGEIMFRKSGDNYIYSRQANKFIGSLLPDFTGGITSNFAYKNFDLSLGFDFQEGGLYYSRTERYMDHSGLSAITAGLNDKGNPKRDPVSSGGGHHIVGVLETGTNAQGDPITDGTVVDAYVDPSNLFNLGNLGNIYENNVHDASYWKLRTVKLNYTFDKAFVEKFNMSAASVGLFANNVWLISSDLPWVDPSELEKRSGINWAENGTLPMTRSIGLNLKLTF